MPYSITSRHEHLRICDALGIEPEAVDEGVLMAIIECYPHLETVRDDLLDEIRVAHLYIEELKAEVRRSQEERDLFNDAFQAARQRCEEVEERVSELTKLLIEVSMQLDSYATCEPYTCADCDFMRALHKDIETALEHPAVKRIRERKEPQNETHFPR